MQEILKNISNYCKIVYVANTHYVWPGGYALGILTKDCSIICHTCVEENLDQILEETLSDIKDGTGDPQWSCINAWYSDADDDNNNTLCNHCSCILNT